MLAAKSLSALKTSGTEMMTAEMKIVTCGRMRVNAAGSAISKQPITVSRSMLLIKVYKVNEIVYTEGMFIPIILAYIICMVHLTQ